ncbi:hypothetical protein LB518_14740 [Mesorhizobium sp. BR1-1-16]|uniref:DUF6867 family protein n=1 Tax=Mesorhizobium sp. BR1-1-16 TaxID=2876653 RepID=UPI001CCDB2BE|nr:hypothetical protein [Mesorhizobium sp. BR1-1-16]MBZ9937558.1 hypothetical protein [Mesorhizobium sp. BR1-1-16]HWJ74105.1 hypothetical protein [Kaistia sp.]
MQGLLYEEQSIFIFTFVTLILGGAGAWMTGRACAHTWRPYPPLVVYLVILSFGVRFIHFALFGGTLLSLHYWLIDLAILLAIGTIAYRYTLAEQMVAQYHWLYEKSGAFSWRAK